MSSAKGVSGYAKRYAGAFADNAVGNYLTEAAFPVMLHQDPRYFRMGPVTSLATDGIRGQQGGCHARRFPARGSSITRKSSATEWRREFQPLTILRPAADPEEVSEKWALSVGSDAGFNILREFWPDMRQKIPWEMKARYNRNCSDAGTD